MKQAKRQIILGALILSLGAAVYLNWQFESNIVPSNANINENSSSSITVDDNDSTIEDEDIGIAQLVNNSYIENTSDNVEIDNIPVIASDPLGDARIARQKARDEATELLEEIIDNENADDKSKQDAVLQTSLIAQNIIDETSAETLIKAKGISDVVVSFNENACNVLIKGLEGNSLIVQEIICGQFNVAIDKIHIIEVK